MELCDLPPIHKSNPQTTPPDMVNPEVVRRVAGMGLPEDELETEVDRLGISLSAVTVRDILTTHGLGTRSERLYALEIRHLQESLELNAEQIKALEKHNPVFHEHHIKSSRPGELLSADTTLAYRVFTGGGKSHAARGGDTYGSYTFRVLHTRKQPEASAFSMSMSSFYRQHGLSIEILLTDNDESFVPPMPTCTSCIWNCKASSIDAHPSFPRTPMTSSKDSSAPPKRNSSP